MDSLKYRNNKTTELFHKLDKLIFFCSSTNFWVDDNGIPELVLKFYQKLTKVLNISVIFFMVAELGSFFTQHNLTEKQKSDRAMMTFSHIIIYVCTVSLTYHRETVTEILFALAVELKKDFNDEDTETHMLKRTKFFACAFTGFSCASFIFYGIDGLAQVLFSGGTFVTVITAWPDVHDLTLLASVGRVSVYILGWIWMIQISWAYLLVLTVTISLSHQYTNLQMYFKSIAGIFEEGLTQSNKEEKFEKAFKLGIRLHATTIWCTQQVQRTCGNVFSGQVIVNICLLTLLLSQLNQTDRSLSNLLPIASTISSVMFGTGVIMWNAGDITVEASNLPAAIFMSGWQNCTHTCSRRIRRLVLIALVQSQKPVVIKCCGMIELSYESYVRIAKTSYSIFSVMY